MVTRYDYDRRGARTAAEVFYEEIHQGLIDVRKELNDVKEAHALSEQLLSTVHGMEQHGTKLGREQPQLVHELEEHLAAMLSVGKGQHVPKIQGALAEIQRLRGGLHSQTWQEVLSKSGAFGEVLRALGNVSGGARTWIMRSRDKPAVKAFIAWYEKDFAGHLKAIDKVHKDAEPAARMAGLITNLVKYLGIGTGTFRSNMSRFMPADVSKGINDWNDLHGDVKLTAEYFKTDGDTFFQDAKTLESQLGQWVNVGQRLVKSLEKAVVEKGK